MLRTNVHRVGWKVVAILGVVGGVARTARAGIGYDNITGNTSNFSVHALNFEYADDTTLDPSFGLTITSVSMLVRNPYTEGNYSGNLRVRVYAAGASEPGTMLGFEVIPVAVPEGATMTVMVPFDVTAPGVDIWTSFEFFSPNSALPGLLSGGVPSIGSSTTMTAIRPQGTGPWEHRTNVQNPFAIRIETVPGPAGLSLAGALVLIRRRRGG